MKYQVNDLQRDLERERLPERNGATCHGLLLYGDDWDKVSFLRDKFTAAFLRSCNGGQSGIARMNVDSLRKNPSLLAEMLATPGFLGEPQITLIGPVTARDTDAIGRGLPYLESDQGLVVTAGSLRRADRMVKLFEGHPTAGCAAIFRETRAQDVIDQLNAVAVKAGFIPEPGAAEALAERVASQDIGRTSAYAQWELLGMTLRQRDQVITPDIIDDVFGSGTAQAMAPMIDALFNGGKSPICKGSRSVAPRGNGADCPVTRTPEPIVAALGSALYTGCGA